jgi:hypothetical protein
MPVVAHLDFEMLVHTKSSAATKLAPKERVPGRPVRQSYAIDFTTPPSTRTDEPVVADAASLQR